ncbi:MAG: hypothetical protein AAB922_05380 [Patescibacteria group bacterium]
MPETGISASDRQQIAIGYGGVLAAITAGITTEEEPTGGGYVYSRKLEKKREDEEIMAVIMAFLRTRRH